MQNLTLLTVEETSKTYHISENKIRAMIKESPDSPFVLWTGKTQKLIKAEMFEDYIRKANVI